MKQNKKINYLINVLFILVAVLMVNYNGIFNMNFNAFQLIFLALIFILVHLFKLLRIYFILLEENVHSKDMLNMYVKTTFTSIILPYKIGEIFKMYEYGYGSKNYEKGIIAVLIDKFFDALLLCVILLPSEIIKNGTISGITLIMLIFLIAILIIFYAFEGTYKYLNKFFIMNKKGKKSIWALNTLEKINNVYKNAKEMIKGRLLILLGFTIASWFIEVIFIWIMAKWMGHTVDLMTITNYLNDAFFGKSNILLNNYINIGVIVFLIMMAIMFVKKIIICNKENNK